MAETENKNMLSILGNQVKELQAQLYTIQITGEIPPITYAQKRRKSFKRFIKENDDIKAILDEANQNKINDLECKLKKLTKLVRMNNLGKSTAPLHITNTNYVRIATYLNVEELLHSITSCKDKYYELPNGYKVKTSSLRYHTFNQNLTCINCGLTGCFLALERFLYDEGGDEGEKEGQGFHLNLYALDELGREVLMTKDHIIPKSKGGADNLENLQTMCTRCNGNKGATMPTSEELEKWRLNKFKYINEKALKDINKDTKLIELKPGIAMPHNLYQAIRRNYPNMTVQDFMDFDFNKCYMRTVGVVKKQQLKEIQDEYKILLGGK